MRVVRYVVGAVLLAVLLAGAPLAGLSARQASLCTMPSAANEAFLDEVARNTWNYLSSDWATDNHLPWSWRSTTISGGDYVNTTEIGLYLLSYIGAYEMRQDWSPASSLVESEIAAVLDQLRAWQSGTQASQPHGPNAYGNSVFFQWYWINWNPPVVGENTGTNQVVPSIDNAFLAASLITIREWAEANNHPALAQKADAILQDMDFLIWYNEETHLFKLGGVRNPQGGVNADYYSNENRIINFIARALGQLSPAEYQASLDALVQLPATYERNTSDPSDDITVSKVAWDGSYFTYTAPALFIREMQTAYGTGTIEPATAAQIVYAQDQGYAAWGLSDCFDIGVGGYLNQGAPPTAANNPPEHIGVITPHASALALITSYEHEAITNLRALCTALPAVYDLNYGFRDSVMAKPENPSYGQASERFSALGQEWLFLSIANQQTGFIWDYFYRDPGVAAAHNEMFAAPLLIAPANGSITTDVRPTFSWRSVPGADGYEMQLGTALSQTSTAADANVLKYVPPSPLLKTAYYWRVRALYAGGGSSLWSEYRLVNIVPSANAAPTRNHYTTATPTLTWNRVVWATEYELQVGNTASFVNPLNYALIVPADTLSVMIPALYNGTYYWRVRAKRGDSPERWSIVESFTIHVP